MLKKVEFWRKVREMVIDIIQQKIHEKGLSTTFLSEQTGISANVIEKCLSRQKRLKGDELLKMANILQLTLKDFL